MQFASSDHRPVLTNIYRAYCLNEQCLHRRLSSPVRTNANNKVAPKTMCQSLDFSIKSIKNTFVDTIAEPFGEQHPPPDELQSVQYAQKVRLDRQAMTSPARPDAGQTINYDCLDKRRSWIIFNWIILFSIVGELFNFFSRSSAGRLNMFRFFNLNKINSSFSLFIYILITSLINTSTIGKFWLVFLLVIAFHLNEEKKVFL